MEELNSKNEHVMHAFLSIDPTRLIQVGLLAFSFSSNISDYSTTRSVNPLDTFWGCATRPTMFKSISKAEEAAYNGEGADDWDSQGCRDFQQAILSVGVPTWQQAAPYYRGSLSLTSPPNFRAALHETRSRPTSTFASSLPRPLIMRM